MYSIRYSIRFTNIQYTLTMRVLQKISDERVFSIKTNRESRRQIKITEMCDENFSIELTKSAFQELILELQKIHDSL